MKEAILDYLKTNYFELYSFWIDNQGDVGSNTIEDHCDLIYSMYLIGELNLLSKSSISNFTSEITEYQIVGFPNQSAVKTLSIHNSAYLLGAVHLLSKLDNTISNRLKKDRKLALSQLIDQTYTPHYPIKFRHHSWRVSHWVGGAPSVLCSLVKLGYHDIQLDLDKVLESCDRLLDTNSGRLKLYKVGFLQKIFRTLYSIKHDPDLGDLGGIVHIHWINYDQGRKFIAGEKLCSDALDQLNMRKPFMEDYPYCLDFDIIQLIRVGVSNGLVSLGEEGEARVISYAEDTVKYLREQLNQDYLLHKLPGALATIHECKLLSNEVNFEELGGMRPIDIISEAKWL